MTKSIIADPHQWVDKVKDFVKLRQLSKKRICSWVVVVAAVLYLAVYAVLSVTGGWIVAESGKYRPMVLAASDIFLWQPRYGECEWFVGVDGRAVLRGDDLGYFFAPLILLDQACLHQTLTYIRPDGSMVDPLPAPSYDDYHSLRANRFHGRFPYTEVPAKE